MSKIEKTLEDLVPKTEAEEEATFVRKARAKGFICRKLNGESHRGWPDELVVSPQGVVTFIEFKRPGKYKSPSDGLSANQAEIIAKLRANNANVLVTDSANEALSLIGA